MSATGRERSHAPFVSVVVVTFLYALGSLAFHYVLGDPAPARMVLWSTLFQGIVLNLVLTWPEGYRLFSATNVAGPYSLLTNTISPYTASYTDPQRFFITANEN